MIATAARSAAPVGLTEREAAERLAAAGGGRAPATSRSYASIVVANVFTAFNAILGVFGVLTLVFGDARDALFLGIVVANAAIGIVQETRAKRTLDRLSALVAPTAEVVRDGRPRRVPAGEVVRGDLVLLAPGDQLVADGRLATADGLRLDESILTGESRPVSRSAGDEVRSGSFVAEGVGHCVVEAVGEDSYAERIAGQARAFRHPRSPLERALNRLLLVLVAGMVPLAMILGGALLAHDTSFGDAVPKATAAMVSLVPEGLILLASLTFAVAAVRMARHGALAQQLNAIESLASADVICLDKTGTLTDATLRVTSLVPAAGVSESELGAALGRYAAASPARNLTLEAFATAFPAERAEPVAQVPFTSRRRWSALQLGDETLVLGAPELLDDDELRARIRSETARGRRAVALARTTAELDGHDPESGPPPGTVALGVAILSERLRPDAARTVAFLRSEGVELKVLSGDAPATVAAIAADAGVPGADSPVDASHLPEDPAELAALVGSASVFGRIAPDDKRRVVEALRDGGRYVAMVGDGVNDVPALKAARLAIAQGSGTQMAKSVADVVLLSGDFSTVPGMVAEGRRILRNVQRVARLFVTKAAFAAFLILTIGVSTLDYPFLPRHLTVASTFGVGLPAFFLALAPSSGPWRPDRFLTDLARFALPAGISVGAAVVAAYLAALNIAALELSEARTVATTVMLAGMLFLIVQLELRPARRRHFVEALALLMAAGYLLVLFVAPARDFFALARPDAYIAALAAAGIALAWSLTAAALRLSGAAGGDR